jgi:hypothetical protein
VLPFDGVEHGKFLVQFQGHLGPPRCTEQPKFLKFLHQCDAADAFEKPKVSAVSNGVCLEIPSHFCPSSPFWLFGYVSTMPPQ